MAGRRIRRLTKPEVLRQIEPDRLLRLLAESGEYFTPATYLLPAEAAELDIERLVVVLADAQRNAPQKLIDALFLIDQMATTGGRDAVKHVLVEAGIHLPPTHDWSPADLAVEAWLRDPQLLSRAYASQLSTRNRSLQLFLANDDAPFVDDLASDDVRTCIKKELAARLTRLDRGDVELFAFPFEGGVRYVIQRGGVFERYGVWNRGESPGTIGYQPLEYDVVVFDAVRRELAVKRDPPAEQTALREAFSIGLASDVNAFSVSAVLNLGPIRTAGEGCLWCRDVPGIRHIRLTAVKVFVQRALKHTREERATDLFQAWKSPYSRPPRGPLLKAEFEFEFDDCLASRSVALSSGASIRLTRDDDGECVNEWMRRRGFILGAGESILETGGLWDWLERPDSWLATEREWKSRLGDQYDDVAALVIDASSFAGSIRLDGESENREIVGDLANGFFAVNPSTGAKTAVGSADIALWRLDVGAVASDISAALGLTGTVSVIEDAPESWYLGDYVPVAGEQFPVYFVTAPDEDSLRNTCNVLTGISGRPLVLVTPTRRLSTPKLNDRLGAAGSGWLALTECAQPLPNGHIKLRQPLDGLLRPFLAIHVPQVFGQPRRPRFPTPAGARWSDVCIRFLDAHSVTVTVEDTSMTYTYEGMGMADKRTPRPTQQWQLLHNFAKEGGVLTWDSSSATRRNQKRRERLADDLRSFFGIDSDPFEYDEDLKGWRAGFTLESD